MLSEAPVLPVACKVMVAAVFELGVPAETQRTHSAMRIAAVALEGLLPGLSPALAAAASEFQDEDRPLGGMRAYQGA